MSASVDFVLAGTGSRSLQSADNALKRAALHAIKARLVDLHAEHGTNLVVMSGMAEGFDKALAVAALHWKIRLWCAIPNRGYGAYYWGRASLTGEDRLAEFDSILARADRVTYVAEDIHRTRELKWGGKHANFWRNDFMVAEADDFVVWNPESKGTAHCVAAIKRAGKWRDDMVLSPPSMPETAPTSTLPAEQLSLVGQDALSPHGGS